MKTKVFLGEYSGQPLLAIYEVDDEGNKKPHPYYDRLIPVVSFGKKKAAAILNHIDEIKDFVEKGKVEK